MLDYYRAPKVRVKGDEIKGALTVKINDSIFEGWKSVTVSRSIRSLTGSYSISVNDKWRDTQESWPIRPDDEVAIAIGGGTVNKGRVITGYVDDLNPSVSKKGRDLPIMGRDKTADIVDCNASVVVPKTEYKNITLERLATLLCTPFGIKVLKRADTGKPFVKWVIKQSETCFETLDRAARLRQIVLTTSPVGNLILETLGQDRSTSNLAQGFNMGPSNARYSGRNRFSEYHVKGQMAGNDNNFGSNVTGAHGIATDEGVKRFRPTLVIAEGPVDQLEAQNRANWEATTRAAESGILNISTPIWLQQDGRLWQINEIINVNAPFLGIIDTDLLITGTTFTKNKSGGSICSFELMRKDAYLAKKTITEENDLMKNLGWSL